MRALSVFLLVFLTGMAPGQDKVTDLVTTIKSVGKEGKGSAAAAKAWKALVELGPDVLFDVLPALDGAEPIAANWIRSAAEAIADKALSSGKRLPAERLEAYAKDVKHTGAGRRLAYDFLVRLDPAAPGRLLPGMLDDPASELRRPAVAVLLAKAETLLEKEMNKGAATATYQKALAHARDADQVQKAAKELGKLGIEVDLTRQFGFITRWSLVGPFDNVKNVGFSTPYPPEKGFDPKATFESKDKKPVGWREAEADQPMGVVDLTKVFGKLKGAVVYGHAVVEAEREQPVEVRAGSFNALRIYLNGKEIYFRNEYHHGMTMDQHIGKGTLKAGRNEVLIKVCQNEQTEPWAQSWSFQLRLSDALGGPAEVRHVGGKK